VSLNKVILIGRLGQDVEVTYTPSGKALAKFSLATTSSYKDKQGQKQENTTWHRICIWGNLGETCAKFIHKGSLIYLEGEITNRHYEDKDTGKKVYVSEVTAQKVEFLDAKKQENNSGF